MVGLGAMASLLDSPAVFDEKAREAGLADESVARIKAQGVATLGQLAFAICQPGETPTADQLADLVRDGAAAPPLGVIAGARRLVFMAQTLAVADVKQMVEGGAETNAGKQMPAAERVARIARQFQCRVRTSARTAVMI